MHIEALKREEKRETHLMLKPKKTSLDDLEEETEESSEPSVFLTETKPLSKEQTKSTIKPDRKLTETQFEAKAIPEVKVVKVKTRSDASVVSSEVEEEKKGNHWDAYLMSLLSKNTANWIVYEKTSLGSNEREKLVPLLKVCS